jgi:hypothetical protein
MVNYIMHIHNPDQVSGFIQVVSEGIEAIKFLGIKILNPTDFYKLLTRFAFNFLITIVIIALEAEGLLLYIFDI